jgi:hypothetical protein
MSSAAHGAIYRRLCVGCTADSCTYSKMVRSTALKSLKYFMILPHRVFLMYNVGCHATYTTSRHNRSRSSPRTGWSRSRCSPGARRGWTAARGGGSCWSTACPGSPSTAGASKKQGQVVSTAATCFPLHSCTLVLLLVLYNTRVLQKFHETNIPACRRSRRTCSDCGQMPPACSPSG